MIDTSLDSSNFYFLLAVFQGIILSLIIVFEKPVRKASLCFGILIFLFSLSLLHLLLEESIHAFNSLYPIPMDFSLSFGPLAYLHVLYIKNPTRKLKRRDLLHFVPSIVLDGLFFSALFFFIRENMDWAYENVQSIRTLGVSMAILATLQQCIYTLLIYKESRNTKNTLKGFKEVRIWLKHILIAWLTIISFLLISMPLSLVHIDQFDDNSFLLYKPLGIIIGMCIYVLGYLYLIKYRKIVSYYSDRVGKISFSTSELALKKREILDILKNQRLYEDPTLTVSKLATHIGWPINDLSSMINETLNTNFNDLINRHRIDAFKEIIFEPDSKKYSIFGLSQKVGFSSKASFYRAFKKQTGITPSDFMKSSVK